MYTYPITSKKYSHLSYNNLVDIGECVEDIEFAAHLNFFLFVCREDEWLNADVQENRRKLACVLWYEFSQLANVQEFDYMRMYTLEDYNVLVEKGL